MLPPESVTRAARRWLELLQRSAADQAWALLQADHSYADIAPSSYLQALDWLRDMGFLAPAGQTDRLDPSLAGLPPRQRDQLLFSRGLALDAPPWLPDADALVTQPDDLPADAADLAAQLALTDAQALSGIAQARGKVDTERTAEIGLSGELALCAALDAAWPGSVVHLAALDDGWGYDIAFTPSPSQHWHLEVKSTTRRGRLAVFLSRNEHTVGTSDPAWRAVAVGLDAAGSLAAVATVRPGVISARAPSDTSPAARWASTHYELRAGDLHRGLPFIPGPVPDSGAGLVAGLDPGRTFAWMPACADPQET